MQEKGKNQPAMLRKQRCAVASLARASGPPTVDDAVDEGVEAVRRQILTVALSAVLLAVALFGVPLAVAVRHTIATGEQSELERVALRGAVTVSPGFRRDPIELPPVQSGVDLGVYAADGTRVAGVGPGMLDTDVGRALSRDVVNAQTADDIVVSVPVSSGESVIAVVRAASARSDIRHRIWWAWAGLAGLAFVAASCAGVLAAAQSRRLSRPLTALEEAATELGGGNFAVRTDRSGIPEIDRAGESLDRTASRLAEAMARERSFSAHASHQLRTPLTTLRLQLETGLRAGPEALEAAAVEAIRSADHLEQTIDDVLALARGVVGRGDGFEVDDLFDHVRQRWHGTLAAADRPLRFVVEDPVASSASLTAARQIVDVLVDNAYRHGAGAVTLRARETAGALAVDVMDEGSATDLQLGQAADPSSDQAADRPSDAGVATATLGLPLARSLAEAERGRLLVVADEPQTRVTLLLPSRSAGRPS